MANNIYEVARRKFAKGEISWSDGSAELTTGSAEIAGSNAYLIAILLDTAPATFTNNGTSVLTLADTGIAAGDILTATGGVPVAQLMTLPTVMYNGACDAADVTFYTVLASNSPAVGCLIVLSAVTSDVSSGAISSATNPTTFLATHAADIPIVWLGSATGLPITPNDGNIIFSWDNGTNKIFRL